MAKNVDILLATYNGSRFLKAQIDSIFNQSYTDWHLYIRDDVSTDETLSIIESYCSKYPKKITPIIAGENAGGAKGNFSMLMNYSKANYILFADQDDIWMPDKVVKSLNKVVSLEQQFPDLPIYVFTDLMMIDEHDNLIAESLWKYDGLNPKHIGLNRLLIQNVPYGCASIINRPLLELGKDIPEEALLHDHWLALLASAIGVIDYIDKPTIKHRIHTGNASRAKDPLKKELDNTLASKVNNKNFNLYFSKLQRQARAVLNRLNDSDMKANNRLILDDFIHLRRMKPLQRKQMIIKHKFYKQSRLQTLKWLLRI